MFTFSLLSWAAWAPGLSSPEHWHHWAQNNQPPANGAVMPDVADIPMMLRRRLGRLGRMAMRSTSDVGPCQNPHLVFSSRYGDSSQTAILMQDLANKQPLSPAKFSVSVHNALAGLWSIQTQNTAPHTAIAAGENSFCHAMLEAQTLLDEDPTRTVLLLHYDEPLPDFYQPFVDLDVPVAALALLLTGAKARTGVKMELALDKSPPTATDEDGALSFIRFLVGMRDEWRWAMGEKSWKCSLDVA